MGFFISVSDVEKRDLSFMSERYSSENCRNMRRHREAVFEKITLKGNVTMCVNREKTIYCKRGHMDIMVS